MAVKLMKHSSGKETFVLNPYDVCIVALENKTFEIIGMYNDSTLYRKPAPTALDAQRYYDSWCKKCSSPATHWEFQAWKFWVGLNETEKRALSQKMREDIDALPENKERIAREKRALIEKEAFEAEHNARLMIPTEDDMNLEKQGKQLEAIKNIMKRANCNLVQAKEALDKAKKNGIFVKPSLNAPDLEK